MAEVVTKEQEQDVNAKRRKAYGDATARLREQFQDEFQALYEVECGKHGVPYKKRLSDREKAALQVEALKAEYPDLFA